jgi:tRNA (adenine57-N1/adenine58-N1)-methyltransferase
MKVLLANLSDHRYAAVVVVVLNASGRAYTSSIVQIRSRNDSGHVFALRFTPELWTNVLLHRTQILYDADISAICAGLDLQPGSIMVEAGLHLFICWLVGSFCVLQWLTGFIAGTGSGSLTHALARAVGPLGKVFTFEFHPQRAQQAA